MSMHPCSLAHPSMQPLIETIVYSSVHQSIIQLVRLFLLHKKTNVRLDGSLPVHSSVHLIARSLDRSQAPTNSTRKKVQKHRKYVKIDGKLCYFPGRIMSWGLRSRICPGNSVRGILSENSVLEIPSVGFLPKEI